jgi:hypothetical protein
MLRIGDAHDVFRKSRDNVSSMLHAKTEGEFKLAEKNINQRYDRHIKAKKGRLENFRVKTELLPNPRKYLNSKTKKIPTQRETMAKEQILTFEQYLSTLNVLKCPVCLECHIETKPDLPDSDYICSSCKKRNDPNYFVNNNLHPVWYLRNEEGNLLLDENGGKIIQYHIPQELKCLTMSERLLIRRCANFVPCVHLKNGVFGIKGHCVTFPQDITEMCDELPLRQETVVTFLRNIANKKNDAIFATHMRVNRQRVIDALKWLQRHNPFYKDIKIKHENFDWMEGKAEANIATMGVQLSMVETKHSKKAQEEDEHVSASNRKNQNEDYNEMSISTVHANEKQSVPSGRQAHPIKEFIDIAKRTGQASKVMKFPPIDHDSPIW